MSDGPSTQNGPSSPRLQPSLSQRLSSDQSNALSAATFRPDRPDDLLPATVYSLDHKEKSALNTSCSAKHDSVTPFPQLDGVDSTEDAGGDPRDYYRYYRAQIGQSESGPFRQDALRADHDAGLPSQATGKAIAMSTSPEMQSTGYRRRQSSSANNNQGSYSFQQTLRGRKSSVRNLVDHINSVSVEEVPPLPIASVMPPRSRTASPHFTGVISFYQQPATQNTPTTQNGLAKPYTNGILSADSDYHVFSQSTSTPHLNTIHTRRKPLFGEVMSGSSSNLTAGYGIQSWQPRSGSPGPPALRPPPTSVFSLGQPGHVVYDDNSLAPDMTHQTLANESRYQNRARSHSVDPSLDAFSSNNVDIHEPFATSQSSSKLAPDQGASSRIPVKVRRNSESSNIALSPQSSLSKTTTHASGASSTTPKRPSPRRRPKTPSHIQSPTRRGKSVPAIQGQKSPLLRANIIAPPPRHSPPLRSSRPRLPVSTATTASSRARMAEKFISSAQKKDNERKNNVRRTARPLELSDVDINARRLRITQALSRSLEGQELRSISEPQRRREFSASRTASPAMSDRSQWTDAGDTRPAKPSLTLNSVFDDEAALPTLVTPNDPAPQEGREYTHKVLQAMQGGIGGDLDGIDSPTLGHSENEFLYRPKPIQTTFLHIDPAQEPSSALTDITVQTEGTTIDPEPQMGINGSAVPKNSVLDQVATLRDHSPLSSRPQSSSDSSEPDDGISVNLILRGTTYLDDSEAIRTGYRTRPSLPALPTSFDSQGTRDSWTSSVDDHGNTTDEHTDIEIPSAPADRAADLQSTRNISRAQFPGHDTMVNTSTRITTASDAYTIVNVVLQRHSANGVVDQQFVDDVYQRILKVSPYKSDGSLDTPQVESLCLREVQRRENAWESHLSQDPSRQSLQPEEMLRAHAIQRANSKKLTSNQNRLSDDLPPLPAPMIKNHKYKSSLDSVEDWADTSPSIGDWMRYANGDVEVKRATGSNLKPANNNADSIGLSFQNTAQTPDISEQSAEDSDLYDSTPKQMSSRQRPVSPPSKIASPDLLSFGSALIEAPQVPKRITTLSQMQNAAQQPPIQPSSASPSLAPAKASTEESEGPEHRRLKRRRHVIKELVDTEFTYEKDLRVLCDIYRQTASAALSDEDIRILFGNVEQVQEFSKEFLMLLKSAGKSTYVMERADRKKEKGIENHSLRTQSSSSTLASKTPESDVLTQEKDRETYLGSAFESSVADMEKVYAEYIRNRQAANQRLASIQKSSSARLWLKQCRDNSSDITNAWNLDALLVKPVQRVTKYPLLLRELVEATPTDHPDVSFLRRALQEVTEVNIRINDVKKHTELVDQVLNRKRKDSDVRAGLSKAFGRRAEKLKQHVGIAEMYEDNEYNEVKMQYDNNIVQLMVVNSDCNTYGRAVRKWVVRMVEIASAAEAWVDVGHSNHQEAESKLRQFAMVTRGISTIALPAHIEQLEAKILQPMQQAVEYMNRLKNDPKGLLQKRDKRMIDYAQAKNKKDKGEKIDKKMTERMEQWEALNVEAKERMRKLIKATATLVQACQAHLVQMQMNWLSLVKTKLSAAMAISLAHLTVEAIVKDWQMDFDYQEASALSLSVCNGALFAEAANMINMPTPSTTLNGEDSPREQSFSTKRSASVQSDGSHPRPAEGVTRTSAQHSRLANEHFLDHSQFQRPASSSNHDRASSMTSNNKPRTPDPSTKTLISDKHVSASAAFLNPSPVVPAAVPEIPSAAPQLSMDPPSLPLGGLQIESLIKPRPPSSSTFFSAAAEPPKHAHHQSTSSSIFSSAMPMSDSPTIERAPTQDHDREPEVLFTAASVYEFNIDRSRREAGFPYLTYVTGEIFDVIGERGELWLAKNQDDPNRQIGWIWNKHFAKLAM